MIQLRKLAPFLFQAFRATATRGYFDVTLSAELQFSQVNLLRCKIKSVSDPVYMGTDLSGSVLINETIGFSLVTGESEMVYLTPIVRISVLGYG